MANPPDRIQVEIFGVTYALRGGTNPEAIREVAHNVDARMKELAEAAPGADPLKVAVLAALRLADEARSLREQARQGDGQIAERVDGLAGRLGRLLEGDAGTPPAAERKGSARTNRALDGGLPLG
jgi:cell division protein ZapA